jgi:isopenicillin N synthase-like dioxygenase
MASDNGSAFSVCESLSETCESLLTHSFAIHRVNEDTANDISKAWTLAQDFFASSSQQKSSCHEIINGNLHGFHIPSNAKELFRAFCGSTQQPWPNDDFSRASEQVAGKLHSLLLKCHNELMRKSLYNTDEGVPSSAAKRLKQTSPLDIPLSALETVDSPLDYFFYYGDKPNAVSCSEHVDRGILICVCLTLVPGLEVLPRGERKFVCPEEICMHQTGEKASAPGLVCIMAGDQLKQIHPDAMACVHRVRNDLTQSRLSISYELRGVESKGVVFHN